MNEDIQEIHKIYDKNLNILLLLNRITSKLNKKNGLKFTISIEEQEVFSHPVTLYQHSQLYFHASDTNRL